MTYNSALLAAVDLLLYSSETTCSETSKKQNQVTAWIR